MRFWILPVFLFLLASNNLHSQNFTISGTIKDAENGEVLIGATVWDKISGKGTISNVYGFYSLTLPSDSVELRVSFVGYQPQTFALDHQENLTINIEMPPGGVLEAVTVFGEESIESTPQMSTINLGAEKIKKIPALLGESDVLKTIQLLPGIQSGTEGTSGIYVRGGGPDQNLILLDGVPVYNASHLFGFFSVFNPDAINRVSVTKGGFPARYGGRLSSVIDISMKEGNNKQFQGAASIGLISSKLTLEGPIMSEKTSFIVSGRRTYIDLLTRPLIKASTDGDEVGGYFFHDINAKVNHIFSDNDRLFLSYYGGKDEAYARSKSNYSDGSYSEKSEDRFGLNWGNQIAAVRWNHLFTPKLFSNLTATYSKYQFSVFSESEYTSRGITRENIREEIEYASGIDDLSLRLDFDYLPTPDHSIKLGASIIQHEFNPGVFAFKSNTENDTTLGATQSLATEWSAYIEDDFSLGKILRFNVGVHTSSFLVDQRSYRSVQPRLTGRLQLPGLVTMKASYAEMAQFIHLLTNGGIGLPTDLWVPSTDLIKPQRSKQVAVGLAKDQGYYQISLESYYKTMSNLIEYEDGASYLNTTDSWEDKVTTGDGTSYGIELLLEKKVGRLNGWLGYTWSKTYRQFEELNFGRRYPFKFDRRHDVSIVGLYEIGENTDFNVTWVYGTGNAISLPQSKYIFYNSAGRTNGLTQYRNDIRFYPQRNNYRMRAYHRLDVSWAFHKQKKRGTRTWSFGAYNVYNRRNPFYIDIGYRNNRETFVQYSLFPMIPFVKYSFKF